MSYPYWHPRYPPPHPEPSVFRDDDLGYPGCALVFAVASFVLLLLVVWLLWVDVR